IWQEVLGVQKIGITDNFFELGGHSLIVVQVINQISKQLGKTISFNMFFANPTIKAFNKELKQSEYLCIPKAVEDESYPLTSSQSRLWILSQFEGGALAYNMPAAVRFTGTVDFDKFEESFRLLIKRHEILRTYFKSNDQAEVRQFIIPTEQVSFSITQKSFLNKNNQHESVSDYLEEVNKEPFDLEKAPLIRDSLIKLREDEHVFFLSMHHIIGDGWSMQLLISEIVKIYNSFSKSFLDKLKGFSEKHQSTLFMTLMTGVKVLLHKYSGQDENVVSGELPVLDLPSFKKRPSVQTYNGASLTHGFSKSFLDKLKGFSERHQSTLFMTLMTGVKVLLHKYSGQDDIVVGTPIVGREHPDLEHQIGLYLNTLAIRTLFKEQNSFLELLNQEKETLLGAYEHQAYPFDELVGKLNLKRDMSRSALFDVAIVLQNQQQVFGLRNEELLSGLQVDNYNFTNKISQTDIRFNFLELEGLVLIIDYNTDIYNFELINRIFVHFENLLTKCIEEQDKAIENIDYLTQGEKQQLLVDFNDSKVDYPKDKTIIGLFEEQVDKTPDNIAVVFEEVQLTYKQLNEKANQLAHYLRETYKIQADDLIGIKLERSEQMILAIFGILKSGAAYVPIDPSYPQERIAYIEKDSNCKIVIDEQELGNFYKKQKQYSKSNALKINKPNDLAYVIYTSGTTGNPKGVMVENSSLLDKLLTEKSLYGLDCSIITCFNTNYVFDVSILEIILPLMIGGRIIIPLPSIELVSDDYFDFIAKNKVTILQGTPSYFKNILYVNKTLPSTNSISTICVGGEIFEENIFITLKENFPKASINNHYGPTETVIDVVCNINISEFKSNNIGSPISNTQVYILDESLQPLPIGVTGKLYVSGAGVARGYLNKPELTAEKFISNPFIKGTRMYDTGDLGRWLPDGNIEFLGRNDHQVKIRGYRIELGEIETAISGYSGDMQQIVVEAKEINQDKTLVAYYVSKTEIDKSELRTYLQNKLPEYMVPGFYVEIESLPLTPNGKIDRKALPSVTGEDIIKKDYVAPRNKEEQLIVDVWTSVLKQEAISVKDSFYNLGGDSIKSIQVASRLRQKGYTVKIDSILRNPIVEDLAKLVQLDTAAISQDIIKGPVVLTPIQKLFFEDGTII
ncbi:amino acid adenylation domain-containing protein, partial [Flavobacterium resistens]